MLVLLDPVGLFNLSVRSSLIPLPILSSTPSFITQTAFPNVNKDLQIINPVVLPTVHPYSSHYILVSGLHY